MLNGCIRIRFWRLFSIQCHIRIQPKCEISDIIHFYEIQIILKPSKSYNHYRNCKLCRVPRTLPSFFYLGHSIKAVFAECSNSNTQQRHDPRQSWSLPSAQFRHSAKTSSLSSAQTCQRLTLGKFWPAVKPACRRQLFAECTNATLDKEALCRVSKADTRQSIFFLTPALQKFSPLHIPHVVLHA